MRNLVIAAASAFAVAALATPGLAGGHRLNIQTGLWEETVTSRLTGPPPIPPAELARLTPQQRAMMTARVQAALGAPHRFQVCATEANMAEAFKSDSSCTVKVASSSPTGAKLHEECGGPGERGVADIALQAPNPRTVNAVGHGALARDGMSMSAETTIHARWLAPACGKVR